MADPPADLPADQSQEPARARLQGGRHHHDPVRHVCPERPGPLPPGCRRDRPLTAPGGPGRLRQAGDPRQADRAQTVHRQARRRHARNHRLLDRWIKTVQGMLTSKDVRVVCYLSAEFLMGPQLGNSLINLGIYDPAREAVGQLKLDLDELLAQEEEPGLGNGGLGRLAACFMDSLSTLEVPAIGYGIRYEFGIFDQEIRDGWQVEVTDKWLRLGNPWEIPRPEITFDVKLGGHTEHYRDEQGRQRVRWIPARVVKGVAYDTPVTGYRVTTTNLLRLWKAEASESFDFAAFNTGDYFGAVHDKVASETISKVLYPNDDPYAGKQLRLAQQYFFVSCSLQDMIRLQGITKTGVDRFHERFAAQLNDTHPSIAVAELMRLLVDEYQMDWDEAWGITQKTFAYPNHTLLPGALANRR